MYAARWVACLLSSERGSNKASRFGFVLRFKSIESYLKTERSSVNIRYFSEWQSIVAECTFLKPDDVEQLYKIYDLVYDYDYHYRLKEERGAVTKDDISQYKELKKVMFCSSDNGLDLEKYNLKYKKLLETLKNHQKK